MPRTGRPPTRYRTTELGPEARCAKCRDWWPADREFFYFQTSGKPHSWCKACYQAQRYPARAIKETCNDTSN